MSDEEVPDPEDDVVSGEDDEGFDPDDEVEEDL